MSEHEDALELVRHRNDFYRDNYRRLVSVVLLLVGLCALLTVVILYQISTKPQPRYFATTNDGRIVPLVPLSEPNMSTGALLQWATQAAVAAYTFDFVHYQSSLQTVQKYFTTTGYRNFMESLARSNTLATVKAKKLVVTAVPTGAPIIKRQGFVPGGTYQWEVQLPMLLTYQSANEKMSQSILVNMRVARVPTTNSPSGVGIASFVADTR